MEGRLEKETVFYKSVEQKLAGLPPVINEYYVSLRANRMSYTSIKVYINNVLHFVNYINKKENSFYKDVTITDIERYFISLETKNNGQRMGDDALQQRWSALNNFFSFLQKRGYISSNPVDAVSRPKNNVEHKVTYLTQEEMGKLFKAIDRNPSNIMAARDAAVIKLGLSTGLRVSALVNINVGDIDFNNNVIHVIEKRQKVRSINIGENVKKMLQEWISVRSEAFGDVDTQALFISRKRNRLSTDAVSELLEKYCADAGIKRITPHKMRSSAACALAKNGLPVKAIAKQLGHSNTNVTMKYIDVFEEDEKKTLDVLDGLI